MWDIWALMGSGQMEVWKSYIALQYYVIKKKSKKLRNITSFWAATRRLYNQHNFLVLQALLPGSRVPTVCQGLWCSGSDGRQHAAWGNSHFLCFWPLRFLSYRYCAHCIGLPALQESYAILESRVEDVELEVRGLSIYPALHRLLSLILPYAKWPVFIYLWPWLIRLLVCA